MKRTNVPLLVPYYRANSEGDDKKRVRHVVAVNRPGFWCRVTGKDIINCQMALDCSAREAKIVRREVLENSKHKSR